MKNADGVTRVSKAASDMIAHYKNDGSLAFRGRKRTWLNAFAESAAPAEGRIPVLQAGESVRLAWLRVGSAIRTSMSRVGG